MFDSGIVPQIERFHGPVEKGYTFLQSFKTQLGSFSEEKRKQIFAGLLEGEALSWYLGAVFSSWRELEEEFYKRGVSICHPRQQLWR